MLDAPSGPPAHINWLHFSDLRMGGSGSRLHDSKYREELERDLRALSKTAGPWDLMVLTGHLTETGLEKEFEVLDAFLDSLLSYLESLGSKPVVLGVPGRYDATWSRQTRPRQPPNLPSPRIAGDFARIIEKGVH